MRKQYTAEFKQTIVDLHDSGQSVNQLAQEYALAPTTIYKWLDLYAKTDATAISKADYLAVKKQLARVQEERDILKKVLTIFAEKKP